VPEQSTVGFDVGDDVGCAEVGADVDGDAVGSGGVGEAETGDAVAAHSANDFHGIAAQHSSAEEKRGSHAVARPPHGRPGVFAQSRTHLLVACCLYQSKSAVGTGVGSGVGFLVGLGFLVGCDGRGHRVGGGVGGGSEQESIMRQLSFG